MIVLRGGVFPGMFRLQREEPYVVVGDVRRVHLPGLLGGAPRAGRAHLVRALHAARHQLDMEATAQHAARGERERGMCAADPLTHRCQLSYSDQKRPQTHNSCCRAEL